jgi:hypothetical protein
MGELPFSRGGVIGRYVIMDVTENTTSEGNKNRMNVLTIGGHLLNDIEP